jgi:hypothetical protein
VDNVQAPRRYIVPQNVSGTTLEVMGRYEFIIFILAIAISAAIAVALSSVLVSVLIHDDDPPYVASIKGTGKRDNR